MSCAAMRVVRDRPVRLCGDFGHLLQPRRDTKTDGGMQQKRVRACSVPMLLAGIRVHYVAWSNGLRGVSPRGHEPLASLDDQHLAIGMRMPVRAPAWLEEHVVDRNRRAILENGVLLHASCEGGVRAPTRARFRPSVTEFHAHSWFMARTPVVSVAGERAARESKAKSLRSRALGKKIIDQCGRGQVACSLIWPGESTATVE